MGNCFWKRFTATLLIAADICIFASCSKNEEETTKPKLGKPTISYNEGFVHSNNKTYYFEKGKPVKGLKKIDSQTYFFDEQGALRSGWIKNRYFDRDGKMLTGLQTIDGKTYYLDPNDGVLFTGWLVQNKKKFFFFKETNDEHNIGEMAVGRQKTVDKEYDFCVSDNPEVRGMLITSEKMETDEYLYIFDEDLNLVHSIDKTKPMVAITYDDGPSKYTPRILDTLNTYDSHATFFVVGERVEEFSKTIKREFDEGHEIGSHTYNHVILTKISGKKIETQLDKTDEVLEGIIGTGASLMRPPGGAYNDKVSSNVHKPMIIWSLNSNDWKSRNKDSIQKTVLNNIKDGDIILMHDLYEATADATDVIVPELKKQGFQLVTVQELADLRDIPLIRGKAYNSLRPKKD